MQEYDADGLIGPNGKFYNFAPELAVGSGTPDVLATSDGAGVNEAVVIVTTGAGKGFVRLPALSKKHGRSVIGSFPDRLGAIQLRFEDDGVNADETAFFVQGQHGFDMAPPYLLWSAHTRHNAAGQKIEFASTSVAVLNPRLKT